MGRAWAELMKRLGYTRYVAQGGDWGAFVVDQMGLQAPAGLLAIHTNMPATVPADVDKALLAGEPPPSGLSAEERRAYEQLVRTFKQVDYARLMGSRPQTLYGIADSPVGLAAWLLDHNDADGQPAAAVASALKRTASATGELTRDEILDNITLYWLTNTGVSTSRLYWEYKGGFFNTKGVSIPVAVSVFPGEQYEAPRSWTERAYPKLLYYNKVDKGGHFAAWEQPQLFAAECARPSDRCEAAVTNMPEELDHDRRHFLGIAAMTLAAARFGMRGTSEASERARSLHSSWRRATAWLNSPPQSATTLRGKVVLVQFGTYTCINWLRTLPYVRAWAQNDRPRIGRDWRAYTRVHIRDEPRERASRRAANEDRLSDRHRQRLCDLARLQQSILARALLHRCARTPPPASLRRGRYAQSEKTIRQLLAETGTKVTTKALCRSATRHRTAR